MARVSKGASKRAQKRELDKRAVKMLPIDRVASKVKQIVEHEGLSCIVYSADANGNFAGGLVGDPVRIADALYHSAKDNKAVYIIMKEVLKSLDINGHNHVESEDEGSEQATFDIRAEESGEKQSGDLKCSVLNDGGELSNKAYNILMDKGVNDLSYLNKHTLDEVASWRGMGKMTLHNLQSLMYKKGLSFKEGQAKKV